MVVVKIIGGLGNQMFQYAAGLSLSSRLGAELKLDISEFPSYSLRRYGLHSWCVDDATDVRAKDALRTGFSYRVRDFLFGNKTKCKLYKETSFGFTDDFFRLDGDVYLDGYWQSEKYFAGITPVLKERFKPRMPLQGKNLETARRIVNSNSISIHVRRGDYITNQTNQGIYSACSADYYNGALSYISQRASDPALFVFSDDISWAKQHLALPIEPYCVDFNDEANCHLDMHLMSLCKHSIIANSSFSWWGAWLGSYEGKIVVAPKRWFSDSSFDTKDLIPERWTVL
jgi:hypothetical protein